MCMTMLLQRAKLTGCCFSQPACNDCGGVSNRLRQLTCSRNPLHGTTQAWLGDSAQQGETLGTSSKCLVTFGTACLHDRGQGPALRVGQPQRTRRVFPARSPWPRRPPLPVRLRDRCCALLARPAANARADSSSKHSPRSAQVRHSARRGSGFHAHGCSLGRRAACSRMV